MDKMTLLKTFLAAAIGGGLALSASAQILLEDFEGATAPWDASNGSPTLSTAQNKTVGGSQSLGIATTADRATWNSFGSVDAFSYTFSYYADSSNLGTNPRNYGQVQSRAVEGDASSALVQLFAIGNYHASGMDASTYQYRVVFGGTTGWFNFDPNVIQVQNDQWVEFNITRDLSNVVTFSVNGVLGATITDATAGAISVADLGGLGFSTTSQPAYFDDMSLAAIPEPSTYAAIFGGLALLGAFVYRRRLSAKK